MSQLNETNPKSLDELFSADPLQLTDQDLDNMIQIYRERRQVWQQEGHSSKGGKKPKVNLDDLGL